MRGVEEKKRLSGAGGVMSAPEYRIMVPGQPVAKARARTVVNRGKVRSYTPEKTARFENLVRLAFTEKYPDHVPIEGPLALQVTAYFEPPKSMRFKSPAEETHHTKRPDGDNICKAISDGLNGVAYKDDSQLSHIIIGKRYSYTPRTEVLIHAISPGNREDKSSKEE
jgi:Holliday junction resolvase RusA-like endonuclease